MVTHGLESEVSQRIITGIFLYSSALARGFPEDVRNPSAYPVSFLYHSQYIWINFKSMYPFSEASPHITLTCLYPKWYNRNIENRRERERGIPGIVMSGMPFFVSGKQENAYEKTKDHDYKR